MSPLNTFDQQEKNWQNANLENMFKKVMSRGEARGWDFRAYVLSLLFYRFLSESVENCTKHCFDEEEKRVNYVNLRDKEVSPRMIEKIRDENNFFLYPSQLYGRLMEIPRSMSLSDKLASAFSSIENFGSYHFDHTLYHLDSFFKDIFVGVDMDSLLLGSTKEQREYHLRKIFKIVGEIDIRSNVQFGEIFSYLLSKYAATSSEGNKLVNNSQVEVLMAKLAVYEQKESCRIYNPVCKAGSLLLEVKKQSGFNGNVFLGQETDLLNRNFAKMNMLMHNESVYSFVVEPEDVLTKPAFFDEADFDIIVSTPPYSQKWVGDSDSNIMFDERFTSANSLAPQNYADLAYVLHSIHYLSETGTAAITCHPSSLHRSGAEQDIRKHLVNNNYIQSIIELPSNIDLGIVVPMNILMLSKHKPNTKIQFIDASSFFVKDTYNRNNALSDRNIEQILTAFQYKDNIKDVSIFVEKEDVAQNNYNLNVSNYVNEKDVVVEQMQEKTKTRFKL